VCSATSSRQLRAGRWADRWFLARKALEHVVVDQVRNELGRAHRLPFADIERDALRQAKLVNVSPRHPLVVAATALTILSAAVMASAPLAFRAARTDPLTSLKADWEGA
jgi:hypothetical protein